MPKPPRGPVGDPVTLGHPFADLSAFPVSICSAGTILWRVVAEQRAATPWWYPNSGDGRFDLNRHSGEGTCYLAESLLGCLLEAIWRDVSPTGDPAVFPPIAPSELDALRAVQVEVPLDHVCADVTGTGSAQLHMAFGITDAIGTCDDYLGPQEWAGAWRAHGLGGVIYRLSHGTGLYGWALFGEEGGRDRPAVTVQAIDAPALEAEGLPPATTPEIVELDMIEDTAVARGEIVAGTTVLPRLGA